MNRCQLSRLAKLRVAVFTIAVLAACSSTPPAEFLNLKLQNGGFTMAFLEESYRNMEIPILKVSTSWEKQHDNAWTLHVAIDNTQDDSTVKIAYTFERQKDMAVAKSCFVDGTPCDTVSTIIQTNPTIFKLMIEQSTDTGENSSESEQQ